MATDVGTLQSKLTLDFSQFASGMNSAISMVRSFGKQLSKALGSNATQGFSTTNQAVNTLQTSITNLQATVSTFQATMQNTNTTLAQFSNVQANTSRIGQDLNKAAQAAKNVSSQTKGVDNNTKKAANNAKKMNNHLNDAQKFAENLKRILGGIVISQAFYRILGVMQDLVSSSVEFMTNMEQSAIAFKYLLGSADNATGFLTALQDFAVASPMDMQGAEQAARMLMTMGFEAESTITVLRTLTDAATVAGGEMSDTVYRIALALGQMLQSGTVKMQELRQLVNANIPIFDILQEELGLTSEQIANIGDASVDSGKAVMAILVGLQKRFGGAAEEMQLTLTGAISAAKDSFYILFNEVMAGPFETVRQKVVSLSNTLQGLAQIARQSGAGGVFEALVPERLQDTIRNVIGAFAQLGQAIIFLGRIAAQIFGGMGEIIVNILNVILPPITIALNAILQFAYGLLRAYPIIKYFFSALVLLSVVKTIGALFLWFWKIIGLGKIIMSVVGYIHTMIKALGTLAIFMMHNPAYLYFAAVTIAVAAMTGTLQKGINKIKEFFSVMGAKAASSNKTLNSALGIGYDPNEILQPTDKETNDSAEKYKDSLSTINAKMKELGDEANKTRNKLKNAFNQSFDEVYAINPNTGDDLGLSGLENIDLDPILEDLEQLNMTMEAFEFDLSPWVESFMISWDEMWANIKLRIAEYGVPSLAAIIGVGMLTKNPWVSLAAGLAALFWPEISNALGLTQQEGNRVLGFSVGTLLGVGIGGLLGGPAGAIIGAAIGSFCGDVMGMFITGFQTGEWDYTSIGTSIGMALGAAIGLIAGGPGGALLGIAIGNLVGYITGAIVEGFKNNDWDAMGLSLAIGTGLGAVIGLCIGGPAGAAIGAGIGLVVGWIVGKFAEADWSAVGAAFTQPFVEFGNNVKEYFTTYVYQPIKDAFENGNWLEIGANILLGILAGLVGAVNTIFSAIATVFIALWNGFCEIFGIHSPAAEMEPIGKNVLLGVLEGILGAIASIPGYISQAGQAIITAIGSWFTGIGQKVTGWFSEAGTAVSNWVTNTTSKISTWRDNFKNIFADFTSVSFNNWCNTTLNSLSTWASNVWTSVKDKIGSAIDKVKEFLGLSSSKSDISVSTNIGGRGHATGGVFDREHWARFAEGNKAEAIIPLENNSAMQPFVDAVSNGLTASLAPIISSMNNGGGNNMQPLYVGTLIADERGLKELERKMEIIRLQENRR